MKRVFTEEHKIKISESRKKLKANGWKPSLDHIEAKANGGKLDINNLQFISWLENRTKVDIPLVEWNKIKENIGDYLV
jgi:hypothetical protein